MREFDTFTEPLTELIEARIWAGLHYRSGDVAGQLLGRNVAASAWRTTSSRWAADGWRSVTGDRGEEARLARLVVPGAATGRLERVVLREQRGVPAQRLPREPEAPVVLGVAAGSTARPVGRGAGAPRRRRASRPRPAGSPPGRPPAAARRRRRTPRRHAQVQVDVTPGEGAGHAEPTGELELRRAPRARRGPPPRRRACRARLADAGRPTTPARPPHQHTTAGPRCEPPGAVDVQSGHAPRSVRAVLRHGSRRRPGGGVGPPAEDAGGTASSSGTTSSPSPRVRSTSSTLSSRSPAAACATSTIRLGTLVTPLPRRRPLVVARQTVTLDRLSGGRLVLGVGTGAGPFEWEFSGEEPDPARPRRHARRAPRPAGPAVDRRAGAARGPVLPGGRSRLGGPLPPAAAAAAAHPRLGRRDVAGDPPLHPSRPLGRGRAHARRRRRGRWPTPRPWPRACATCERGRRALRRGRPGGERPEDDGRSATFAAHAGAGATWWVEAIHPWRYGDPDRGEWNLDAMQERILAGP